MVPIPLIITLLIASLILCGLCCYSNYLKRHITNTLHKDIVNIAIVTFDVIVFLLMFITIGSYFGLFENAPSLILEDKKF